MARPDLEDRLLDMMEAQRIDHRDGMHAIATSTDRLTEEIVGLRVLKQMSRVTLLLIVGVLALAGIRVFLDVPEGHLHLTPANASVPDDLHAPSSSRPGE